MPVGLITRSGYVLVAHPSFAAQEVAAIVAETRARPGQVRFGVGGVGTPPHLGALTFFRAAGIEFDVIPFTTGPAGLQALLRGDVSLFLEGGTLLAPQIRAGSIRGIAVTTGERKAEVPELPTMAEAGLPGGRSESWLALMAPRGVPAERVARLNEALRAALAKPDVAGRLTAIGLTPQPGPVSELAALIAEEDVRAAALVRDTGLSLD